MSASYTHDNTRHRFDEERTIVRFAIRCYPIPTKRLPVDWRLSTEHTTSSRCAIHGAEQMLLSLREPLSDHAHTCEKDAQC